MQKILKTLIITTGLLGFGNVIAEEPPQPGEAKPFTVPAAETLSLDNGLEASMTPFGKLPKVAVQVTVRTGNLNEGERTWLADLTGSMMEEGAGELSGAEVASRAAAMGGSVFVNVGSDLTTIGGEVLAENGPELVSLLADITRRPTLPESEFERVKSNLLRSASVMAENAQNQARDAFQGEIFGDHPYGNVIPDMEKLQAYTLADVQQFHAENFGAQRTNIYVTGRYDNEAMASAIETAFADWPAGPDVLVNVPEMQEKHRLVLRDRPGAPQSTILIGLPVVDPSHADYIPLSVMNTLLGGAFSSRITSNIREDKGYTYSPRGFISTNYRTGLWGELADVTTEHTADSVFEILKEVQRLRDEAPAAAELEGFKTYMIGNFVRSNASRGGIAGQQRYMDLHGLPDDHLDTYVQKVQAVTPEQVRRMAEKYLTPESMTLVVVGDLEKVKPQLEKLDWIKPGDL